MSSERCLNLTLLPVLGLGKANMKLDEVPIIGIKHEPTLPWI